VFVEQLTNPQAHVRQWAATGLGEIGPAAKDAVPALADAQNDSDPAARNAVRRALELIDTAALTP
jgi:HEAT repeat protein